MGNIDRFMEANIPLNVNIVKDGLWSLISNYKNISINGLKVDLVDDVDQNLHHVFTFMPTLSSLYFLTRAKAAP